MDAFPGFSGTSQIQFLFFISFLQLFLGFPLLHPRFCALRRHCNRSLSFFFFSPFHSSRRFHSQSAARLILFSLVSAARPGQSMLSLAFANAREKKDSFVKHRQSQARGVTPRISDYLASLAYMKPPSVVLLENRVAASSSISLEYQVPYEAYRSARYHGR